MTNIIAALTATQIPFAHYAWNKPPAGEYLVYAEDSASYTFADNKLTSQILEGTIDLFTRDDTGAKMDTVQQSLDANNVHYYLNSIQYESDTGLLHYEWVYTNG